MRTEVAIYYFDADWSTAWGECNGKPVFLPISDCPIPLKAGQRVALDGVVEPFRQAFLWDRTQVRILQEGLSFPARSVTNLSEHARELKGRLVSVEGLIDRLLPADRHLKIDFLARKTFANVYVQTPTNAPPVRFKEGDFVRVKCVYGAQFDQDGGLRHLGLWVVRPEDIEVIGSLATDPRFAVPATPIEAILEEMPQNQPLRVEGIVRRQKVGHEVTVWDATGQVTVQSRQTLPLRVGDRVEAVGYPNAAGAAHYLQFALYRPVVSTNAPPAPLPDLSGRSPLRLTEWIRNLSPADARRRLPVKLRGVVTWSNPQAQFCYVEDASGGIRVLNPAWRTPETSKPGTVVELTGEVMEGDYVPVVTNAVVSRIGWWGLDEARPVTFEQAMTGAEDGQWVEMGGYVREVRQVGKLTRLGLSTSRGEFRAWVAAPQEATRLRGSIVRVRGVCAAVANARHQLTGVELLSALSDPLSVDEPTPDDLFAAPLRPLDSLRRFDSESALGRRIHTSGTVTLHAARRYLFLQEHGDAVFVLSQQDDALRPGDRVEVVGFPGYEGRRFLLREAAYRRTAPGKEPAPVPVPEVQAVNADLDGVLARAEGTLLNIAEKDGEVRLLVQDKASPFEVCLDSSAAGLGRTPPEVRLGGRLGLTGVYEARRDENGDLRSFQLRLRSWGDVRVLRQPPWWTLTRLFWSLLAMLGLSVVALVWGGLISRKNMLLSQAQTELKAANDQLELRVRERTRDLESQVRAEERARAELAAAQDALILASRQAGMAEVATNVLHNVGNVLNSVNVSASLLEERLRQRRTGNAAKAVALLRRPPDQVGRFLSEDPQGKILPAYLEELVTTLERDRQYLRDEVRSLIKNVEHINTIVAMQQGYASFAGVLEPCDVRELVEDAIQMNAASLNRHRVQLVRDYKPAPRVLVDRHKVLQILINLVNNAKQALDDKTSDKRIVLQVCSAGPERVRLSVADNGAGIAPENLSRIFSQGFTTKKRGHGFGLHSGANAARELGGSLSVQSDGPQRGATFTLELPAANLANTASPSASDDPRRNAAPART
ncbi:MAG: ATP-binding protein [Limisphaerales bacterium]